MPRPNKVEAAFLNWKALRDQEKTKELCEALEKWSRRWNLKAEWCLDYTVTVLRYWLFDKSLPWALIWPKHLLSSLISGSNYGAREEEVDVLCSRFELAWEVHGDDQLFPPFEWSGLHYDLPSFDFINETAEQWKRKARLLFRIFLAESELGRLKQLKKEEAWRREIKLENEQNGALTAFDQYLNSCNPKPMGKVASEAGPDLVKSLRELDADYFRWLVLFQVPDIDGRCLPHSAIAKDAKLHMDHVRKSV